MKDFQKWLLAVCCSVTMTGVACNDVEEAVKTCGNGALDKGEACDGQLLNGKKCADFNKSKANGTLKCKEDCSGFDTSACKADSEIKCGDNVKNGNEVCDGSDLGGQKCEDIAGGGFNGGSLSCKADCSGFETSACTKSEALCGDKVKNGMEECDDADLGGATCESLSSPGATGTLKCVDCKFDISECVKPEKCGNNVLDENEVCDTVDGKATFAGDKSCKDYDPKVMGGLACNQLCGIDASGCVICVENSTKCEKVNDVDTEFKCAENKWPESGTACGEGKVCDADGMKCVDESEMKCEGDAKQCVDGKERACKDGKWGASVECEKGFECKEGGAGCTAIEGFCTESMCKDGKFVECKGNRYQAAVDCPEEQECKEGAKVCTAKEGSKCTEDVCKEGMFTKCEEGKAKTAEACKVEGKDVSCNAAGTACGECANDAKMCDGNNFKKCDNGAWVSESCGTKSCDGEKGCVEKCSANSCENGKFIECKNGVPQAAVDCKVDGQAVSCNAEGTACGVCLDNAKKCDDNTPKVCTKGAWTGNTACKGNTAVCVEGECKQCKGPSTVCVVEGGSAVKKECTNAHTWKQAVKCESGACNAEGTDCAPVVTTCTDGEKKCVKGALLTCKSNKFSVSTDKEATCNHYETCTEGAKLCSAIVFGANEVKLAEWNFDDKTLNPKVCISNDKTQCSITLSSSGKYEFNNGVNTGKAAATKNWPKSISDAGLHWKISVPTQDYDHLKVYTRVAGSGESEKGFKLSYLDGTTVKMLKENSTEYKNIFISLDGALPESYSPAKLELRIYAHASANSVNVRIDDILITGVKKGGGTVECTADECKDGMLKRCVGGKLQAAVACESGHSCKSATACGECVNDSTMCDGNIYKSCTDGQWLTDECKGAKPVCSPTEGCVAAAPLEIAWCQSNHLNEESKTLYGQLADPVKPRDNAHLSFLKGQFKCKAKGSSAALKDWPHTLAGVHYAECTTCGTNNFEFTANYSSLAAGEYLCVFTASADNGGKYVGCKKSDTTDKLDMNTDVNEADGYVVTIAGGSSSRVELVKEEAFDPAKVGADQFFEKFGSGISFSSAGPKTAKHFALSGMSTSDLSSKALKLNIKNVSNITNYRNVKLSFKYACGNENACEKLSAGIYVEGILREYEEISANVPKLGAGNTFSQVWEKEIPAEFDLSKVEVRIAAKISSGSLRLDDFIVSGVAK